MSEDFKDLLKEAGNEYAAIADDGIDAGDITGYIGTGSLSFNALLSGSLWGGLPNNKVTALAGEPSTGKTFYAINIVEQFLKDNDNGFVFIFESESAISKEMLEDRGVDVKRTGILPVATIQEFRTQAVKILDKYMLTKEKNRPPMLFILDSLGNLSTQKEVEDITSGKDTRDMTRSQLIRGAFRVLTLKLGKAKVALIVTNHTYDVIGSYVPMKKMGGGCLIAETKIQTPNGPRNIDDLRIGEYVDTLDGPQKIIETYKFDNKRIFEIEFEDGSIVSCSGDHKFLISGQWVSAYDLVDQAKNTETIDIDVSDIQGPINVYRKQIHKNLSEISA